MKFETYDESVIIDKINSLLTLAKLTLAGNQDLYFKDLFFWSAIDKSLKLIDTFLFAFLYFGGLCETIGQIFYMAVMFSDFSAGMVIISAYCAISVLWSRIL